jgi:cytochrome c553
MYSKVLATLAFAAACSSAFGQTNAPAPGQSLAAPCAICHGTDGRSVGGTERLAGMSRHDMVRKFGEYKSGAKPASVMHQIAKGYSDKEIALLAEFFAAQKK